MNFGRNITLDNRHFYTPASEPEVLQIMDRHRENTIRCVGRLHSWNEILNSKDVLMDLRLLNQVDPYQDEGERFADFGAGCQVKRVLSELASLRAWTLPSVGFITEQTVAGAVST